MERGSEGFFVVNKGENKFNIPALDLTLTNLDGCYRELRNNFTVAIERRDRKKKFITRWGSWNRGGMEVQKRDALYFIREPFTAVFFCMRYKVTGFEAGGRRQKAGGRKQKNNLVCEFLVLYLI